MSKFSLGLIVTVASLVSANVSYACRCSFTPVEQNYKNALAILEGKVLWTFAEDHSDPNYPKMIIKDTYAAIQFTKALSMKNGLSNSDVAEVESIIEHKKVILVQGSVNTGNSCGGNDLTNLQMNTPVVVAIRATSPSDTFQKMFKEFDSLGPCSPYNNFFSTEERVKEYREFGEAK